MNFRCCLLHRKHSQDKFSILLKVDFTRNSRIWSISVLSTSTHTNELSHFQLFGKIVRQSVTKSKYFRSKSARSSLKSRVASDVKLQISLISKLYILFAHSLPHHESPLEGSTVLLSSRGGVAIFAIFDLLYRSSDQQVNIHVSRSPFVTLLR